MTDDDDRIMSTVTEAVHHRGDGIDSIGDTEALSDQLEQKKRNKSIKALNAAKICVTRF